MEVAYLTDSKGIVVSSGKISPSLHVFHRLTSGTFFKICFFFVFTS